MKKEEALALVLADGALGAAEEQLDFMEERLYEYESVVIKSQLKSQMLNKSNGDL